MRSFLRRWRWVFLGLLALSLLIMIVEVAISEYTPPLEGPWDVLIVVLAGTIYISLTLAVLIVFPIVLFVELARWWRRTREETNNA